MLLGLLEGHTPTGTPNDAVWPGEGQYLESGGVTDINYITGPTYLLNYGVNAADRVDFARVREFAVATTQQALYYAETPEEDLLKPTGLFGLGFFGVERENQEARRLIPRTPCAAFHEPLVAKRIRFLTAAHATGRPNAAVPVYKVVLPQTGSPAMDRYRTTTHT